MRVVTGYARRQRIVGHRVDLRVTGRSGRLIRVTARAELPVPRQRGLDFHRIRHVRRRRAVTRFTRHPLVVAGETRLHDRGMTERALLLPRVLLRVRDDRVDRGSPIVPGVAERIRNQEVARHDER